MGFIIEKTQLQSELCKAIQHNEFYLLYQPKVDLKTGKIEGAEALIRWNHPEKGLTSPLEFIPAAEELGLISEIGEWVIHSACIQIATWQKSGLPPLVVAVNLSVVQLFQANLIEMVQKTVVETKIDPRYLEIEITESMMMDPERALPVLQALKKIGVRISLDDFGTGYSSLRYLKDFPVDIIKIDQSFVRNCTLDGRDATITRTIIAVAHQLDMEVIAEGIESRDQLIFLQHNLCEKGQGYLFSRPLPPDEFVHRFSEIEQVTSQQGIPQAESNQIKMEQELEDVRQELMDTVRMQQGTIFKYREIDGRFIHTLCDGELVYRMNLTPEHIVGKSLDEIFPRDTAEQKLEYYRRAWHGEPDVTYEGVANGIFYLASLRPIVKGGQVVEVIASCVDITERVKRENEVRLLADRLKQEEEKYRLIVENAHDLIEVLDPEGVIKYASPSHERVLERSVRDLEGENVLSMVHVNDISYAKQCWDDMMLSKNKALVKWRYQKDDGSYIWIEGIGTPIVQGEDVESILVVGREIPMG